MVTGAEQGRARHIGRYAIGHDARMSTYVPTLDGTATSWSRLLVDAPTLAAPFLVFQRVISIGTRAMTFQQRRSLALMLVEGASAEPLVALSSELAPLRDAWASRLDELGIEGVDR